MSSLEHNDYQIGIICALVIEQAAILAMLDVKDGIIKEKAARDQNTYFAGRIHDYRVVVACLPLGVSGVAAAAAVAKDMIRTFQQLRFCLLVGIDRGIPNREQGIDIRLGDVVFGQPEGVIGGVVQYDKGKVQSEGTWVRKGHLNASLKEILSALGALKTDHEMGDGNLDPYLAIMLESRPQMKTMGYGYPGDEHDVLYALKADQGNGSNPTSHNELVNALSKYCKSMARTTLSQRTSYHVARLS